MIIKPASQVGGRRGEGIDLDRLAAPASLPGEFVTVGVGHSPFSMVEAAAVHLRMRACPACGGKRLRGNEYCILCDSCGLDGRGLAYPGLPIGRHLNADYVPDGPAYVVPVKPGGKGRKATGDDGLLRRLRARKAKRRESA